MKHVAVESDLTPISDYLESKGYTVEFFEGSAEDAYNEYSDLDAVIISGINENMLGIEDTEWDAVIIDASGKTPEEVEQQIRE